ncbi:hypothetical protein CF392_06870 [Tamilnaduibacter salinus]|uniref:Uncharacterized protein n=1 Tax=Tamilnaduibacter salinus TaxID=1484056 RepID=A0A2A2I533_9GAMM|nr:hypothetical protein CF392_06870 [Tamilnaduibacter salinus]
MLREKEFVGYFPELRGRSTEEQISLIGCARYEVFVRQGRGGRAALVLVVSFLLAAAVAFLPLVFWRTSFLINSMFIAVGVFISMHVYKRLYGHLLKQGLRHVLENQS